MTRIKGRLRRRGMATLTTTIEIHPGLEATVSTKLIDMAEGKV
ncbi:MAG: hypothetical protein ABSG98_08090 [Anaerolineales bacterium]